MCDFENGFVLCSCEGKEKPFIRPTKSKRHKAQTNNESQTYRWSLSEFVETYEDVLMEGIYEFPLNDIGKGLTSDWVLLHLNDGNCFDFAYTPKEGDNLVIMRPTTKYDHPHLSFIFENGAWIEKHYTPFCTRVKQKQAGIVQALK